MKERNCMSFQSHALFGTTFNAENGKSSACTAYFLFVIVDVVGTGSGYVAQAGL